MALKEGQKLMMVGTADEIVKAPEKETVFMEDLPEEEQAVAVAHSGLSFVAPRDRLTNFYGEIFDYILGFLDMKYVMQTSLLSGNWRHFWASVSYLKFDSYKFNYMPQFVHFVKRVLSQRNIHSEVLDLELTYRGNNCKFVEHILLYAHEHGLKKLNLKWFTHTIPSSPNQFFSCVTLKHLTLDVNSAYHSLYVTWAIPKCPLEFT